MHGSNIRMQILDAALKIVATSFRLRRSWCRMSYCLGGSLDSCSSSCHKNLLEMFLVTIMSYSALNVRQKMISIEPLQVDTQMNSKIGFWLRQTSAALRPTASPNLFK